MRYICETVKAHNFLMALGAIGIRKFPIFVRSDVKECESEEPESKEPESKDQPSESGTRHGNNTTDPSITRPHPCHTPERSNLRSDHNWE